MDNQTQDQDQPTVQRHSSLVKTLSVVLLIALSFYVGYSSGRKGFVYDPKSFKVVNQQDQQQTVDYNQLWDAINVLNTKYIDKPVNPQKVLYGAVAGAVSAAGDPYTTFFTPDQLSDFQTSLQGSFQGIGAEVGAQDGSIVIVAPLDGSPAQKAGLLAKDIIAAVNGQSTEGWSVEQAVQKIRGPKGTSVTLSILRQGHPKAFDVKITRDDIVIKSVKWSYKDESVNGQNKKIAIITINQFGNDTQPLFNQAVNDILKQNVAGLIVDLRNNPGGYLQTAVALASDWVPKDKVVVSEAHSDGTVDKYNSTGSDRLSGLKTVVLINGGSASAAEILSGALRDWKLAELLGEKSFGKGSVQELVNLPEGGAVKVTIAKWITPGGVNLNKNGLNPDVPVVLTEDDAKAGKDPQMDKALQEFTK